MNKGAKLKKVISYLKGCEIIKTQRDFADAIYFNHTNLSSALNGNESYLTDGLFCKILDRFPEVDFIINGDGANNSMTNSGVSGNNNVFNHGGNNSVIMGNNNLYSSPNDEIQALRKENEYLKQLVEQQKETIAVYKQLNNK